MKKNKSSKKDIIKKISEKYPSYDIKAISKFYKVVFDTIQEEIIQGQEVNISGFGTFNIREKKERKIHSIDGTVKTIPKHKSINFTVSRELKKKLN